MKIIKFSNVNNKFQLLNLVKTILLKLNVVNKINLFQNVKNAKIKIAKYFDNIV